MGSALLSASDASFAYPSSDARIGPFDFEVERERLKVVYGPSGCGKSTLARMLCGVIPHLYEGDLRGDVLLDGRRTADLPFPQVASRVGAVFQNPEAQLLGGTVAEEIDFGLDRLPLSDADRRQRRREVIERFDLGNLESCDPRRLSGGEQQRVLFAAVSARRPEVLLLDEPLSMLDDVACDAVLEDIHAMLDNGAALVAFEHRRARFSNTTRVDEVELGASSLPTPLPEFPVREGHVRVQATGVAVELAGRPVLDEIDFDWRGGQAVAVHGANGSGKTTLLRTLCGLQEHRGRLQRHIDDREAPSAIGLCYQNADHQIFNGSVRDELLFGCPEVSPTHYRAVLELTGLGARESHPPLLLSEGEKKRLALGLLLMRDGLHGLCLDEPTLGQDATYGEHLGRVLRRLVGAGYLCVVATHDEVWAKRWCERSVRLVDGRIEGNP